MRNTLWAALALAAFVGCTSGDPNDINNTIPKTPQGVQAEGGAGGGGGGMAPGSRPEGYPAPKNYQEGSAAASQSKPQAKGGEAKSEEKTDGEKKEGEAKPAENKDGEKKEGEAKPEEKKDGEPKVAAVSLTSEEIAEINKLPDPKDRAEALSQKVCVVTDEHLGGEMGVPFKEVVDGKAVFLCCKGCEKEFKKDPSKFLAKAEELKKK